MYTCRLISEPLGWCVPDTDSSNHDWYKETIHPYIHWRHSFVSVHIDTHMTCARIDTCWRSQLVTATSDDLVEEVGDGMNASSDRRLISQSKAVGWTCWGEWFQYWRQSWVEPRDTCHLHGSLGIQSLWQINYCHRLVPVDMRMGARLCWIIPFMHGVTSLPCGV